jgi:hypothetical protein
MLRDLLRMAAKAATPLTLLSVCATASVVSAGQNPSAHGTVPVVQAIRATTPIVVDGQLNDEVWRGGAASADFIMRVPGGG